MKYAYERLKRLLPAKQPLKVQLPTALLKCRINQLCRQ